MRSAIAAGVWALAVPAALAPAPASAGAFREVGGDLSAAVPLAMGAGAYSPIAFDADADGDVDLAVGAENGDVVVVRLRDGDAYGPARALPAGDGPQGLAAADLDADGDVDLVAANLWSSTLTWWRGDGRGGFAFAAHLSTGANPHAVAVADFDGDGRPDLASANGGNSVSILRGGTPGQFLPATTTAVGINPRDLRAADFDGDGRSDLVLTAEGAAQLLFLRGRGDGGFDAAVAYPVGARPQLLAVADMDADGRADVAVPSLDGRAVHVFRGVAGAGLVAGQVFALDAPATAAAFADFDGDRRPDLVVATHAAAVQVFRNDAAGGFLAPSAFDVGASPSGIAAADVDADGKPDLAVAAPAEGTVRLLTNLGERRRPITPSVVHAATSSYALRQSRLRIDRQAPPGAATPAGSYFSHAAYADVDQDGDHDVLRTFSDNDARWPVQLLVNLGNGVFADQTASRIVGPQPGVITARKILVGDYDDDGWPDFLVLGHGVDLPPFPGEFPQLFLSNGDGTLTYDPQLEPLVGFHHGGASADVDGDGDVDVLLGAPDGPLLLVNDGRGRFTGNRRRLPDHVPGEPLSFFTAELVDADRDGFVDLFAGGHEHEGTATAIYWGAADGLYRRSRRTVLPAVAGFGVVLDVAIDDLDGDGTPDLVVNRTGSTSFYAGRRLQFLRGLGARAFADESAARMAFDGTLPPFDFLRAQDVDADGDLDLFADDAATAPAGESAWANDGGGRFAPRTGPLSPAVHQVPVLTLRAGTASESGRGGLPVVATLSSEAPPGGVAFVVESIDGASIGNAARAGVDFQPLPPTSLSISPGRSRVGVRLKILDDEVDEPDEVLRLRARALGRAHPGRLESVGRIVDDDTAAPPAAAAAGMPATDAAVPGPARRPPPGTGPGRAPVAASGSPCATLARAIVDAEDAVVAGRLAEAEGIRRILALEHRLVRTGCARVSGR